MWCVLGCSQDIGIKSLICVAGLAARSPIPVTCPHPCVLPEGEETDKGDGSGAWVKLMCEIERRVVRSAFSRPQPPTSAEIRVCRCTPAWTTQQALPESAGRPWPGGRR